MKTFEVAIIGSGPAGASAALKLALNGISTVIIEKETLPRYKTCGGGFVYRGRRHLPFDISPIIEREFNKVDLYFDTIGVQLSTEREQPIISMIMREDFDFLLVEKAKKEGVTLLENQKLQHISFEKETILRTNKEDIKAKFIIAADGALSTTAKLSGWKETRLLIPALEYEVEVNKDTFNRLSKSVRFDFDAVPLGYGWCFPKKNHLSIGLASTRRIKINLKTLYKEYLKTLGIDDIIHQEFHGFQIPVTPRTAGYTKNGVFLVGDAAGFADPVTAEGISNAIFSGNMAAEAIIESRLNINHAEELYQNKLNKDLLPELKTGVRLSKLFYEQAKVRNFLMKRYGKSLAEGMTDVFMGEYSYPKDIIKEIKKMLKEAFF